MQNLIFGRSMRLGRVRLGLVVITLLAGFLARSSGLAGDEKSPPPGAKAESPPGQGAAQGAAQPEQSPTGDEFPNQPPPPIRPAEPPPPPAPLHQDPDRTHGADDIWMTREGNDGRWSVPVNLGPNVNTTYRESSAAESPDGKWLFFSSRDRRDGFGRDDLYVCAREGDGWGPATNLDARNWSHRDSVAVNTVNEEIGACPFPDGKTLMFCRRDARQRSYDLLITLRDRDGWLEAIGFGRPLATPGEERLPSITRDGLELFFTANWRNGQGGYDIWQTYRDERGNWRDPVNLGPRINTPDTEYSPGISPDGRRLFYASKHEGERSFDIFMTERKEGGTWQDPVRLPPPVNTRYEEYCPSVAPDGKTLYFTSDRPRGTITVNDEE